MHSFKPKCFGTNIFYHEAIQWLRMHFHGFIFQEFATFPRPVFRSTFPSFRELHRIGNVLIGHIQRHFVFSIFREIWNRITFMGSKNFNKMNFISLEYTMTKSYMHAIYPLFKSHRWKMKVGLYDFVCCFCLFFEIESI